MSNSTDSTSVKEQLTVSPSKVQSPEKITHAVPISTIPPQDSTKKKAKSSVKKEKLLKFWHAVDRCCDRCYSNRYSKITLKLINNDKQQKIN
ncbi:hypothetical protein A2U01_0041553 [Trifolium medium]|uniref:Uncharacterized protein n=1 Tax=Trifolium medium TaxID=97028 RepID=A0A392Q7U2_9FABA|nr:hypothetical protein [Trifolium medium]